MGHCSSKSAVTLPIPIIAPQTDLQVEKSNLTGTLQSNLLDLRKVRKVRRLDLDKSGLFRRRLEKQIVETPSTAALDTNTPSI